MKSLKPVFFFACIYFSSLTFASENKEGIDSASRKHLDCAKQAQNQTEALRPATEQLAQQILQVQQEINNYIKNLVPQTGFRDCLYSPYCTRDNPCPIDLLKTEQEKMSLYSLWLNKELNTLRELTELERLL